MSITGLGTLQIPCSDIDASTRFYTDTLGMTAAPAGPGKTAVVLGEGLIVLYPWSEITVQSGLSLSLACNDVDATVEVCRAAGVSITQEPTDQPWGTREAAVTDPSGFTIFLQK